MPSRLPLSLRAVAAAAATAVLVLPSVALADEDNRSPRGQQNANSNPGTPQGDARRADPKASPKPKPKAPGKAGDSGNGRGAGNAGGSGNAGSRTDNGDPAGNNGTIKIDYPAPADSGHANRPHPGCAFQLRMFNFDDDQYGALVIKGQSPTDVGTLLTRRILLSNDPAGGGHDVDEVYSFTAADLGLTGTPPHKNGWHLKVAVNAENAPGGAKQKVLWLDCPPAEVLTPPAQSQVRTPQTRTALILGETNVVTSELTVESQAASKPSRVLFTGGGGIIRGALPMTGLYVTLLLAVGAAAVVLGAMTVAASRRRGSAL